MRVSAALGVTVAVPAVAACGAGNSGDRGTSTNTTSLAKGPEVDEGEAIVREAAMEPNSAVPFTDAGTGQPAVLVRLESGEFVAYSAMCTHQRCTVAYRRDTRKLVCPCHGSVFDPAGSAAVETGPAPRPLPNIEVELRGGKVFMA